MTGEKKKKEKSFTWRRNLRDEIGNDKFGCLYCYIWINFSS